MSGSTPPPHSLPHPTAAPPALDETVDFIFEQLSGLGELRARKMFGGVGLYCDELFFALVGRGALYMKVDDSNRADYEARGCEAFRPDLEQPQSMNYFELPVEVLERREEALAWGRKSLEVARRARAGRRATSSRSRPRGARGAAARARAATVAGSVPIAALRNLGPASAAWLREVGVATRADLERLGAVGAFRAVEADRGALSLNLLYALEAALLDVPWTQLPPPLKQSLRAAVGR